MRNEDTLNGTHGQSAHHRPEHETASGRMTVRHAHVPTAQGEAPHAAPFLVQASAQRVIPGPEGVVTLPAGVELSDVHVVGRDLVVSLPDGTQMIIVDGAVFVPELVIGTVEVPATNLAALLIDAEPKPAAGQSSSSGGNFAVPVGPLDPGAPLGDLLPPTELAYTPPTFKELGQIVDNKPSVIVDTPDQPAGAQNATASVNEAALPKGSNPSSTAETTTGSIVVTSLDNPTTVTINGVVVTGPGQVIAGTYPPTEGEMMIDGLDSRQYHPHQIRDAFRFVGQDAELFSGTVRDNLMLGAAQADDQQLIDAVVRSGADLFLSRDAAGFDLPVGERGSRLSGGQRSMLLLARALVSPSKMLFLDEPTGAMDTQTEAYFIDHLRTALGPDQTLIVSTHRHQMLSIVDRLIVIDAGRVLADGPRDEVIAKLNAAAQVDAAKQNQSETPQ